MTIQNTVDAKAVGKDIKTIARNGAKLDTLMHNTAVACILLSLPDSEGGSLNCNSAALLLNAMPKGSRAKALVAWFHNYSNTRLTLDNGKWTAKLIPPTQKMYAKVDVAAARANPFWSVEEKDTNPAEFNFGATLAKLLAKAEKNLADMSDADKAALAGVRKAASKVLPKVDA